jgi:LemA protein
VRDFNTSIQTFPSVLIAGMFGFSARDYFQIEGADAEVPTVNLRNEPPQAAPPAAPPQA